MQPSRDISRLIEIMAALRNPDGGCPWDLDQDYMSIRNYTIEEAYEVADAIERGNFEDLREEEQLVAELMRIGGTVWRRIESKTLAGRTVTLKVKYRDFRIITRARSLDRPVAGREEFLGIGCGLLRSILPAEKGIRLLGLTLSNLSQGDGPTVAETPQLGLPI